MNAHMTDVSVVNFGPYRVIGVRYAGKNEHREIPAMWEKDFLPRMGEITMPADQHYSFGLCRCLPGVTDGSFEYIAAAVTTAEASVPEGMVDVAIPAGTYAVFPVASLNELSATFQQIGPWLTEHREWQAYCGDPESPACDCANHPTFELYTAEFPVSGKLFIYVPVQKRE